MRAEADRARGSGHGNGQRTINSRVRLQAATLFLIVFVLGMAFGALGNRIWNQRVSGERSPVNTQPTRDEVIQNLTQRLQLTPEQQRHIGAAIDDTRSKWQSLEDRHEVVRQQFRANVREILTPEQQVKFDEFLKHLDEGLKNRSQKQAAR